MEDTFNNFPSSGLLPKKETGALSFLSKYPDYDGRGVVIAILDTGVDPGALGLQVTSDSKPKIIDLIDATGAGNVDISTVGKPDSDGFLAGVTGRKLKVPSSWSNPSSNYHLGFKALFDLCSRPLRERLKQERKDKLWQPHHEETLANLQKKLNDLNQQKNSTSTTSSNNSNNQQKSSGTSLNDSLALVSSSVAEESSYIKSSADLNEFLNSLTKEDLQTQFELVKDLENKIKDVGPVYDCIVWNDGQTWRCCVDTTEKGDLENCKVLTNYKDSFEYGTFSYADMLNYSVRILPDENILQIVTDSGSHGTHVASIASGYFPDRPELNGIAPGAQIISIKIGDNRINSMETCFALGNACRYVIEYKCDLVNYSFGEPINFCNQSSGLQFFEELSQKYGVVVCGSAGNNGPGIETVDAPGSYGTSSIGVAAYVSSDMIKAEHSLLGNGNSMLFSWSSRGPQLDGHLGVTVCAPGGAIASVPNWTQRGSQLMSGTSMSSPNCCGCIGLILSGLKANNIEFNPFGVKRAIENTALSGIDETIGVGAGLIQVEKAYDYLVEYKDCQMQKIQFDIKCPTVKSRQLRGIYLKNSDEVNETREYSVIVEPIFFENQSKSHSIPTLDSNIDQDLYKIQKEKISFNKKVALIIDNSDNATQWIEVPSYLYLVNSQKQFMVRIHANKLEEGRFYFTQIKAYDLDDPKRACLFKIPITIVKPYSFDSNKIISNNYELEFKNVQFKQGQIYRHFIKAPHGATHAELVFKADQVNSDRDHSPLIFVQTFTLGSFRSPSDSAREEIYRLNTTNEFKYIFKVQSNKVCQVTIAKNWSNIGQLNANYTIKLNGIYPKSSGEICCLSSQPCKLEVGSYLKTESCEPSIHWKHLIQPLKPVEHQIEIVRQPIGLIKPVFQIVLTYNFHQTKTDDVCCEVPLLSHYLYENEYQSMFWMLFEANNKRFLFAGDAFPVLYKYSRSLDKGDYVIRLHVRHEKIELLEKIKDITLYVRHSISGSINQDIFTSYSGLLKGVGKKTGAETLNKNTETTYYINTIPDDKLPKGTANGYFLSGDISFYKDASVSKIDTHRILYQINNHSIGSNKKHEKSSSPPASKVSKNDTESNPNTSQANIKIKTDDDKLKEAIRDLQVSYILKSNEIFETLKREYENHVQIYLNRIQYLEQQIGSNTDDDRKLALYDDIISLCKTGIDKINQNDLLKFLGEKHHDPLVEENKKDYENQKNWIIDLYIHYGLALIEKLNLNGAKENQDVSLNDSDSLKKHILDEVRFVYRSLQKWIDINDDKVSKFTLKFYLNQKLFAKGLKILYKQSDEKPTLQATDSAILNVLKQMNLTYAQRFFENHIILKYQKQYAAY